ncbi:MAG: peptide ABC transporter substrate-binding protein, partial [Treponema sp.]|nr:peptide ABC transporter substrate-binding protein [Treponema sp.]
HVNPEAGTYYLLINQENNSHPALRDPRVRKALSMAIDRDELIDNVIRGGQLPALSLVPPGMGTYTPAAGNGFNLNEARRLLAEAGYANGQGLPTFDYLYNTSDAHRIIGEYLQQAWRNNLGVNIDLRNMEWGTYLDARNERRFQIARAGWVADYIDPQNLLDLLITDLGNNDGKYSNAEYDRLIMQANSMSYGPERNAIMLQAEEIGITQDQAVIPIYFYVSQNMIDLNVWQGWYSNILNIHPYVGIKKR